MSDRIDLRGLRVFARHGVYEHEQADGQWFEVDVSLECDLSVAGGSDRLDDTVDYGAIAAAIHGVVATERWDLIERVATRVSEAVLDFDPRLTAVSVTVHKPEAPIPHSFRDVSVTIRRER